VSHRAHQRAPRATAPQPAALRRTRVVTRAARCAHTRDGARLTVVSAPARHARAVSPPCRFTTIYVVAPAPPPPSGEAIKTHGSAVKPSAGARTAVLSSHLAERLQGARRKVRQAPGLSPATRGRHQNPAGVPAAATASRFDYDGHGGEPVVPSRTRAATPASPRRPPPTVYRLLNDRPGRSYLGLSLSSRPEFARGRSSRAGFSGLRVRIATDYLPGISRYPEATLAAERYSSSSSSRLPPAHRWRTTRRRSSRSLSRS
jgi:hypothetical protein